MTRSVSLDMLRQRKSPARSQRKIVQKDQLLCWRSLHNLCISRSLSEKIYILRATGKLGSRHVVEFSKDTWNQIKIRKRKDPSRGIIQKCASHERDPCARRRCSKKNTSAEQYGIWQKIFTSSRTRTKLRFILLLKQKWYWYHVKKVRGAKIYSRFRSINAHD